MGLCGIGPVGFFDLEQTLEVISIENLAITGNEISSTLLSPVTPPDNTTFGYGAICVPDVDNLVVRDNTITDFGATLSAEVSGIFVLHAEMAEISRNQVLQTGAWTSGTETQAAAGLRAGIMLLAVTPPALSGAGSGASAFIAPLYQPGVPAVRVEHNVVQVAVGEALEIVGLGPFSVVNNSLSSGGTVLLAGTVARRDRHDPEPRRRAGCQRNGTLLRTPELVDLEPECVWPVEVDAAIQRGRHLHE